VPLFADWKPVKYLYTSHEFFVLGFVARICYLSLLYLYLSVWVPLLARGEIVKLLLPLLFFLTNPLATWSNIYLYSAVTASEISLNGQFFYCMYGFYSRQISYDEIAGIIFKCNSKFAYREKLLAFKCRIFGNGPKESQFVIKFKNNDYVIVRSEHAKEILAAVKKACPLINIY